MRQPNSPCPDLFPFEVKMPRKALAIGKKMADLAGIDPAIALGAILASATETVTSPEAVKKLVATYRADLEADENETL